MVNLTTKTLVRSIAPALAGTTLMLMALALPGCSRDKGSSSKDGKQGGQTDLRQAVLGKWAIISDNPAEKDTTLEITADKWVWNNPGSLAKDVTTITFTYTLSGDQLERTAVSKFKSSPTKSKIQVAGDIMTETIMKEDNKHLYGSDKGAVVTKYQRVK